MTVPFWVSIGLLSLAQGAIVALPRRWAWPGVRRLRNRWWAVLPAASVAVFVAVGSAAAGTTAQFLTYLALVIVPPLAALALAWSMRGARLPEALLALPLFVLAWLDRGAMGGQVAALALSGLSCVALGSALAAVVPGGWLAWGIVAMAAVDAALVASDLLQGPNSSLVVAHPAAGLPRLQTAVLGSASMGYGDLFIAGVLGGLLAACGGWREQLRGAALTALLAVAFDLLFFWVNELPATVPVAGALVAMAVAQRWGRGRLQGSEDSEDSSEAWPLGAISGLRRRGGER